MSNDKEKIDILNRGGFINHVVKIVKKIAAYKGNMTFAINGDWGCGKTFVLDKIKQKLKEDKNNQFLVIPYNCWQYDYYEEPLVAIVSSLLDFSADQNILNNKELTIIFKEFAAILSKILAKHVERKTGINIREIFLHIKNFLKGTKDNIEKYHKYDNYYTFKKALLELQEQLKKLSEKYTIVFSVDELDRCLPEYAIKILERLHHIAEDVPNMITIIAIDKRRLEHTIGSIFGGDENAENYLRKFIKFEVHLDQGMHTSSFFEKFPNFYNRFDASRWELDSDKTDQFLEILFRGVNIRSQEQIIEEATIFNDICFKNTKQDQTIMYMELFLVTLNRLYNGKSFFLKKKTFNSKNIFASFPEIPEKFKDANSGFNFTNNKVIEDGHYTGIIIDPKNIFMVIFLYFYNLIDEDTSDSADIKYRPYIQNNNLADENIKIQRKIRAFLRSDLFGSNTAHSRCFTESHGL